MTLHRNSSGRLYAVGRYGDVMAWQAADESDTAFTRRANEIEDREEEKL